MWCGPRLRQKFLKMARGPKSLATPELKEKTPHCQVDSKVVIFMAQPVFGMYGIWVTLHTDKWFEVTFAKVWCLLLLQSQMNDFSNMKRRVGLHNIFYDSR